MALMKLMISSQLQGFFTTDMLEIINSDKSLTLTNRLHALMRYFYTRKETV